MAKAVETSKVVLLCMSEKYKDNSSCRSGNEHLRTRLQTLVAGRALVPRINWNLAHLEKFTQSCVKREHGRQLGQILPSSVSKKFSQLCQVFSL